MKRWLTGAVIALAGLGLVLRLGAAEGAMRASKPEVRTEIVATIEGQLAAFRQGDVSKAYGYAAAELRAQKSQRVFKAIVQENYPEIWANTRAEFGIVRDNGARASVTVQVYAKPDEAAYDFTLTKEAAGWRIFSVLRHEPKKNGKV
jgi:hypothetical protein